MCILFTSLVSLATGNLILENLALRRNERSNVRNSRVRTESSGHGFGECGLSENSFDCCRGGNCGRKAPARLQTVLALEITAQQGSAKNRRFRRQTYQRQPFGVPCLWCAQTTRACAANGAESKNADTNSRSRHERSKTQERSVNGAGVE